MNNALFQRSQREHSQTIISTVRQTVVISTITTSLPSTSASPQYTSPANLRSAVLNSTNTYRYQHNATALTWNATLESYAKSHVNPCKFAHTHGPYGENLAQGYPNVTAALEAWGDERQYYDFGTGGFSEVTGHFTQLVWKATRSTGCGVKQCGESGWLIFCEYWPPGNVLGEFTQQVQQMVRGSGDSGSSPPENTQTQTGVPRQGGVSGYTEAESWAWYFMGPSATLPPGRLHRDNRATSIANPKSEQKGQPTTPQSLKQLFFHTTARCQRRQPRATPLHEQPLASWETPPRIVPFTAISTKPGGGRSQSAGMPFTRAWADVWCGPRMVLAVKERSPEHGEE
ncbi:MAG: hypothetical protein Q9163_004817 [Psora crenata]